MKFQDIAKLAKDLPEDVKISYSNYTIGYGYFKTNSFGNALNYYSKVTTTLNPDKNSSGDNIIYLDATLRLGDCYFMMKDYKKAETNYSKIIDNNGKGVDYALFQKGMLQGLQGNNTGKIATLQQITSKYSKSFYVDDAMYETANTYFVVGQNQSAISGFHTLINEKPNSSYLLKAYLKLGLIHYNQNDYKNSEKYYRLAYETSPNSPEADEAKSGLVDIVETTGDADAMEGVGSNSELDNAKYNYAKTSYDKTEYSTSSAAFGEYLQEFPKGQYEAEAIFYRGESYYKLQQYEKALLDYESLISSGKKNFLESALLRASWIEYYQNEDYKIANKYFTQLYDIAEYKENSFVAMKGLLRTAYFLNDYDEVIKNANRILTSDLVTNDERIEANYYGGKAYVAQSSIDKAYESFSKTARLTTNEFGVEARFHMADILFQKGKLEEAKKQSLEIINYMPSYEEWVIRSYILLADIAAAKGDYAQAKATLNSIIDNYSGNADLFDLAKQKLDQIEELEQANKKTNPSEDEEEEELELNFNNN